MREFVRRLPPELQKAWHETVGADYRARAAKRKQVEAQCQVCGTDFVGIKKRRYCSRRCQQIAYRERLAKPKAPPAAPRPPEAD